MKCIKICKMLNIIKKEVVNIFFRKKENFKIKFNIFILL